MNGGSFTQTGIVEMRHDIEKFSDDQTAALKAVASATATRVHASARRHLLSHQKTATTELADAIKIEEDAASKKYDVVSYSPVGQPTNLNIWNEHGTIHMEARPYMRPAADEARERYRADMEAASMKTAEKTFS